MNHCSSMHNTHVIIHILSLFIILGVDICIKKGYKETNGEILLLRSELLIDQCYYGNKTLLKAISVGKENVQSRQLSPHFNICAVWWLIFGQA